jgi:hypothetical protein
MYSNSSDLLSLQSSGSSLVSQLLHYLPSFDLSTSLSFSKVSYGPSNPFDYPPPYPIPDSAKIVPIITYPCHIRVDHYHVIFVSGEFKPDLLAQGNSWDGPLCGIQYMARGGLEMVTECVGKDVDGLSIVHFPVVSNF